MLSPASRVAHLPFDQSLLLRARRRGCASVSDDLQRTRCYYRHRSGLMTELTLTAIYEEAEEGGYIGYLAELPGANTQGETLEEVRENLTEAIQLVLEANREEFERHFSTNAKVTRERLILRAA